MYYREKFETKEVIFEIVITGEIMKERGALWKDDRLLGASSIYNMEQGREPGGRRRSWREWRTGKEWC